MNVDGVGLMFPDSWTVERYDEWAYVRNQFNGSAGGCKAVIDPVSLQQKLRSRVKPIDPHPVITSGDGPWQVVPVDGIQFA